MVFKLVKMHYLLFSSPEVSIFTHQSHILHKCLLPQEDILTIVKQKGETKGVVCDKKMSVKQNG